ncbi:MAG TPA: DUF4334 domain-containing protein [Pseudonocardia sp.]
MEDATPVGDAAARLAALEPRCTTEQALAFFDELPTVAPEAIGGRWAGRELDTRHPWNGLLSASGWYGKQFDGPDAVHPLLFRTPKGTLFPLNPAWIPLRLVGRVPPAAVSAARRLLDLARPLLQTHEPKARLRSVEYRGRVSAAMIYDQLPIVDVLRRVDDTTLLGLMDTRATAQPFFFVLNR